MWEPCIYSNRTQPFRSFNPKPEDTDLHGRT